MKKYIHTLLFTTAFGVVAATAETDCVALAQTVNLEVTAEKNQVLEIVGKYVAASPNCACEVVKTAIKATEADSNTVAAIVEVAITSAPDQSRLISQCAIATAPDAISGIQAVLAKLDPNSGDSTASAKSAKGGKAPMPAPKEGWNPLDFPGDETSVIGPRQGTDPNSELRPGPQFGTPPIIDTPVVTDPGPGMIAPGLTNA